MLQRKFSITFTKVESNDSVIFIESIQCQSIAEPMNDEKFYPTVHVEKLLT